MIPTLLARRELGIRPFDVVHRERIAEASRTVALNTVSPAIVPPLGSPIVTLAIDAVESRFMVAGTALGSIYAVDLLRRIHSRWNRPSAPSCEPFVFHARPSRSSSSSSGSNRGRSSSSGSSSSSATTSSITALKWFPRDNGMFLSGSAGGRLIIWDSNAVQEAGEFNVRAQIQSIDMSSIALSHNLVAVASNDVNVRLCDLVSGSSTHTLAHNDKGNRVVRWSPREETVLVSGGGDGAIKFWDIRQCTKPIMTLDATNGHAGQHTLLAHEASIIDLTFHPSNGLSLFSTAADGRMRQWDIITGKKLLVAYNKLSSIGNGRHYSMAISNDGQVLYRPSGRAILVESADSGQVIAKLSGHYGNVICCSVQTSTQYLISGSEDQQLLSWISPIDAIPVQTLVGEEHDNWSDDEE